MSRPKKNRVYEDWFTPRDFYGNASMIARDYCKAHPDADKNTVYYAASEAAAMYDLSPELRKRKFKNFVYFRIHTAVYIKNRKDNETMAISSEVKETMIKDYQSGMTVKEIAERYQLNPKITYNNFLRWSKKGLLTLRTPQKPVHVPKKEEPAAEDAAASSDSEVKIMDRNGKNEPSSDIIPHEEEESQALTYPFYEEDVKKKYRTLTAYDMLAALANGKTCYCLDRELVDAYELNNMTARDFAAVFEAARNELAVEHRFIFWCKEGEEQ